jgi:hypothetical protein
MPQKRSTSVSGHMSRCAISRLMHRSNSFIRSPRRHSAMSNGGTVRPNTLAVLRLMISSTLVDFLDRQFGWLVALENTSGVDASQTARIRNTGAVANQAPAATNWRNSLIAGTKWRIANAGSAWPLKNASVPIRSAPVRFWRSTSASVLACRNPTSWPNPREFDSPSITQPAHTGVFP